MSRHISFRSRATAALLGLSLLALSACGSDAADSAAPAASSAPAASAPMNGGSTPASAPSDVVPFSVTDPNGPVSLQAKPVRIISLSPTHTEMLFAIGAGAQVVAVDDQSNFPAEVAAVKTDLSGFTPNIEAIATYKPDLVVIGDDSAKLSAQLGQLGIPVWYGPAATSLDDVYAQIEQLGVLTDHVADSASLVATMSADVASLVAEVPKLVAPLTYYHELDPTYFSATSNTFIGQLYALAGLRNVADTAEAGNDYPQLNAEFIVSSNPDIIFLADTKCCGESAETVSVRDGWAAIAAVKSGHVVAMDDDISSRWGPRVVDYLRSVVDAVKAAAPVTAG
ncbi:MAG: ABC transporter substrate-binding protein [Actinobacteria bacterium]|nr:ABC transporter substrate-binding protein [Actinomycetota bacterium]